MVFFLEREMSKLRPADSPDTWVPEEPDSLHAAIHSGAGQKVSDWTEFMDKFLAKVRSQVLEIITIELHSNC